MLRAEPEKAGRPFFFISTECATRVVLESDFEQKFIIGNPSMENLNLNSITRVPQGIFKG